MTARPPLVTVGIPVFNAQEFLAQTLTSVLEQTVTGLEIIISDNASTDATARICAQFAERDARIKYVRHPRNTGAPNNYNSVAALASGKYFKWWSSSDICKPELLEKCVAALEAHPDAVLAYAKTRLFDGVLEKYQDYEDNMDLRAEDPVERYRTCLQRLRLNNVLNGVIKTAALKASTGHEPYQGSDMILIPELALHGKFIEVPEPLFYRREQRGGMHGPGTEEVNRLYFPDENLAPRRLASKRLWQLFRGVWRAPITLNQKLRMYVYAVRSVWWARVRLLANRDTLVG